MEKLKLIFLMIALLIPNAYAIAVTPSKTVIYFSEDKINENLSVTLWNTRNIDIIGEVYLKSKNFPEEYLNFEKVNISFEPGERKDVNFNLFIPSKFDEPGDYRFDLIALEIEKIDNQSSGASIKVRTAVGSIFTVRIPREGHFLTAKLTSKSVTAGEKVPFLLTLENLGTLPINDIQGILEIYDSSDKKIDEVLFIYSLPINSIKDVELFWDSTGFTLGNYKAKAILNFEGKTVEAETSFKLGDIHITILEYDKSIETGKINKYRSIIRSDWGESIKKVHMSLDIQTEILREFKSESFDLQPWEVREVIIFVDAEDIRSGTYPAKLDVFYQELYTEENFDIKVRSIFLSPLYLSFIIVSGLSILLLISFIIILRKKKNGRKK